MILAEGEEVGISDLNYRNRWVLLCTAVGVVAEKAFVDAVSHVALTHVDLGKGDLTAFHLGFQDRCRCA